MSARAKASKTIILFTIILSFIASFNAFAFSGVTETVSNEYRLCEVSPTKEIEITYNANGGAFDTKSETNIS
jgi:hypothetical protein